MQSVPNASDQKNASEDVLQESELQHSSKSRVVGNSKRIFVEFFIPPPPPLATDEESSDSDSDTQDDGFEITGINEGTDILDYSEQVVKKLTTKNDSRGKNASRMKTINMENILESATVNGNDFISEPTFRTAKNPRIWRVGSTSSLNYATASEPKGSPFRTMRAASLPLHYSTGNDSSRSLSSDADNAGSETGSLYHSQELGYLSEVSLPSKEDSKTPKDVLTKGTSEPSSAASNELSKDAPNEESKQATSSPSDSHSESKSSLNLPINFTGGSPSPSESPQASPKSPLSQPKSLSEEKPLTPIPETSPISEPVQETNRPSSHPSTPTTSMFSSHSSQDATPVHSPCSPLSAQDKCSSTSPTTPKRSFGERVMSPRPAEEGEVPHHSSRDQSPMEFALEIAHMRDDEGSHRSSPLMISPPHGENKELPTDSPLESDAKPDLSELGNRGTGASSQVRRGRLSISLVNTDFLEVPVPRKKMNVFDPLMAGQSLNESSDTSSEPPVQSEDLQDLRNLQDLSDDLNMMEGNEKLSELTDEEHDQAKRLRRVGRFGKDSILMDVYLGK